MRRRGFMAKKRLFFSFWYLGPHRIASKNYENIFLILFEMKNQKNKVKNSGGDRNKVKNYAKVGSPEIFFDILRNRPRFFGLKDVELNSESNGTG